MSDHPSPGEVWIVSDPKYGPEYYDNIDDPGPIIITAITSAFIHYVCDIGTHEGSSRKYKRGIWDWHKHMTRIWPLVESWDELEERGITLNVIS